jgi:hypothetical protein
VCGEEGVTYEVSTSISVYDAYWICTNCVCNSLRRISRRIFWQYMISFLRKIINYFSQQREEHGLTIISEMRRDLVCSWIVNVNGQDFVVARLYNVPHKYMQSPWDMPYERYILYHINPEKDGLIQSIEIFANSTVDAISNTDKHLAGIGMSYIWKQTN